MQRWFPPILAALSATLWPLSLSAAAENPPSSSAAAAPAPAAVSPVSGKISPASAEVKSDSGEKTTLSYLISLPAGPAPAEGWPLLVFLHGSGERGKDLEEVKTHGPPKLFGKMKELDSFLTISPQCPDGRWWDRVAVKDLVDQVIASQPVDKKRIYLTGISMGGFGVWDLLKAHPGFFTAAIPICGGGDPSAAGTFKDVPIWIFHGGKDEAVPVQRSIDMDEALKKAGGHPQFTLYPEVGHNCWTRTYENPEIYAWLLSRKRG